MKVLAPLLAAAAVLAGALAYAASPRSPNWSVVVRRSQGAVYALSVGHPVPLRLSSAPPQWLGTGFQLLVPNVDTWAGGGAYRVVEVTACHLACNALGHGRYTSWGQVFVAPVGTSGYLHPNAFSWRNTTFYPNADVAISTHVIQRRSQVDLTPFRYGHDPAVRGYLHLGNFSALRPGDPVLVLGNAGGRWVAYGNRPLPTPLTYLGLWAHVCYQTGDIPLWPAQTCLPEALAFSGHVIPGDSGSPVLSAQGSVVGVLVAASPDTAFAVPLDPVSGAPVGGVPVQPSPPPLRL
jgi:hypothetical protein